MNRNKRIQGAMDVPLTQQGRLQAKALAASLCDKSFGRIYSSPLRRAAETAEIISTVTHAPVSYDERLLERAFGLLEGAPYDQLQTLPDGSYDFLSDYAESGAESLSKVEARLSDFLEDLKTLDEDRILVVSHGAAGKVLLEICGLKDTSILRNCDIVELVIK